jgi:hypothetical protein
MITHQAGENEKASNRAKINRFIRDAKMGPPRQEEEKIIQALSKEDQAWMVKAISSARNHY